MGVARVRDRPVYKQVADALRAAIRGGQLADGALLAPETELMARYGVSRNSVRNAVALLRAEGLVVTEHGRGTFVRARRPLRRLSSSRYSKAKREAAKQGMQVDQQLLGVEVVDPPQEVVDRLGLEPGEQVVLRRHLLSVGGEPVQLAGSHVPLDIARGTPIERFEKLQGGVHALLEHDLGHKLERFVEELTFRMPTPEEARQLGMGAGVPVV